MFFWVAKAKKKKKKWEETNFKLYHLVKEIIPFFLNIVRLFLKDQVGRGIYYVNLFIKVTEWESEIPGEQIRSWSSRAAWWEQITKMSLLSLFLGYIWVSEVFSFVHKGLWAAHKGLWEG